jgi:hypothetical protein
VARVQVQSLANHEEQWRIMTRVETSGAVGGAAVAGKLKTAIRGAARAAIFGPSMRVAGNMFEAGA